MQGSRFENCSRYEEVERRVRPRLESKLNPYCLRLGSPVFMRIFKQEKLLELWVEGEDKNFVLFGCYRICACSGELGPKLRQGDKQAPEGFYRVGVRQLNPNSRYHLGFDLGFPNAYDRAHGRTGDHLMVHGGCVSVGCYAMGDASIEEIYTMVAAALDGGQAGVDVHAFPFRLDARNLEAQRKSPWFDFWMELKPGHDFFEETHELPIIGVRERHYTAGGE